eukprot:1159306-Pelagomonas_calceolata.AAC.13
MSTPAIKSAQIAPLSCTVHHPDSHLSMVFLENTRKCIFASRGSQGCCLKDGQALHERPGGSRPALTPYIRDTIYSL